MDKFLKKRPAKASAEDDPAAKKPAPTGPKPEVIELFDGLRDPAWRDALSHELSKPYLAALASKVGAERSKRSVYPPAEQVYTAFNLTPFDRVRVVVIGQDPYHNVGQARALSPTITPRRIHGRVALSPRLAPSPTSTPRRPSATPRRTASPFLSPPACRRPHRSRTFTRCAPHADTAETRRHRRRAPPHSERTRRAQELEADIPRFKRPNHGHLKGWATQGVFMLNASLTVTLLL